MTSSNSRLFVLSTHSGASEPELQARSRIHPDYI